MRPSPARRGTARHRPAKLTKSRAATNRPSCPGRSLSPCKRLSSPNRSLFSSRSLFILWSVAVLWSVVEIWSVAVTRFSFRGGGVQGRPGRWIPAEPVNRKKQREKKYVRLQIVGGCFAENRSDLQQRCFPASTYRTAHSTVQKNTVRTSVCAYNGGHGRACFFTPMKHRGVGRSNSPAR